jgi:hypothetical protein
MAHTPPPVPPDQRSPGPNAHGQQSPGSEAEDQNPSNVEAQGGMKGQDGRQTVVDVASPDPGDADVNTKQQGRFGDIAQNTTHQGYQQDR